MSGIVIVVLICHRYKAIDSVVYNTNSSESKETLLWFVILIPFYLTNTIISRLTHQPSSLRLYSQTALSEQLYYTTFTYRHLYIVLGRPHRKPTQPYPHNGLF
jgi:hypothetical protein